MRRPRHYSKRIKDGEVSKWSRNDSLKISGCQFYSPNNPTRKRRFPRNQRLFISSSFNSVDMRSETIDENIFLDCQFMESSINACDIRNVHLEGKGIGCVRTLNCRFEQLFLLRSLLVDITSTDDKLFNLDISNSLVSGSRMNGPKFGSLRLYDSRIESSSFLEGSFYMSMFIRSRIDNARFSDCLFEECVFIDCHFTGVRFDDCRFDGCLFFGCTGLGTTIEEQSRLFSLDVSRFATSESFMIDSEPEYYGRIE